MMIPRSSLRAAVLTVGATVLASSAAAEARNVVLVHGMVLDGSGWRAVHDILVADGYDVSVVQNPLTGLDEDVAATTRILDRQDGPTVLVGQSYGGAVITAAGEHPDVAALVYVAALQPDVGETVAGLNASFPPVMGETTVQFTDDGLVLVDPAQFREYIAADVPEDVATFMANSQVPTSPDVFTDVVPAAAWRDKPSFAVLATRDRSINPDLQRWMYERAGASITELDASHLPHVSQPEAVAAVIMEAARAVE